jgi:hypothetical protein
LRSVDALVSGDFSLCDPVHLFANFGPSTRRPHRAEIEPPDIETPLTAPAQI